jgi:hydrogenase maturation protease
MAHSSASASVIDTARFVVIGIGNPLRTDDGLGWVVATQLAEATLPDTECIALHQLTPELVESIHMAECVIFVDASVIGSPGTFTSHEIMPTGNGPSTDSHNYGPEDLLDLAQSLYGHYPRAVVLTVTGADFDLGETLSSIVATRVPEVCTYIQKIIATPSNI